MRKTLPVALTLHFIFASLYAAVPRLLLVWPSACGESPLLPGWLVGEKTGKRVVIRGVARGKGIGKVYFSGQKI